MEKHQEIKLYPSPTKISCCCCYSLARVAEGVERERRLLKLVSLFLFAFRSGWHLPGLFYYSGTHMSLEQSSPSSTQCGQWGQHAAGSAGLWG